MLYAAENKKKKKKNRIECMNDFNNTVKSLL